MVKFSAAEIRTLFIAALVLGLLFGYDDGQANFQLSYWITNVIIMIILALFSLIMYVAGHKVRAKKFGCESSIHIWSMSRFSYAASSHLKGPIKAIPLGVIIPLLLIFLTQGAWKVATFTSTTIKSISARRLGREFRRVTEFEEAQIALAGPLTALLVAFIAKILMPSFPVMQHLMVINLYLAMFNMLPIPTLDGVKIYFGSPLMFTFFFVMILGAFFFLSTLSVLSTIIFAFIIALAAVLVHYNRVVKV